MNQLTYSDNAGSVNAPNIINPFAGFNDLAKITQNVTSNLIARQDADTKLENVKNNYELGKEQNQLTRDKLNMQEAKDQQAKKDALANMRAMAAMMGAKDMDELRRIIAGYGNGTDLVNMHDLFKAGKTNMDWNDRVQQAQIAEEKARLQEEIRKARGG